MTSNSELVLLFSTLNPGLDGENREGRNSRCEKRLQVCVDGVQGFHAGLFWRELRADTRHATHVNEAVYLPQPPVVEKKISNDFLKN